MTTAEIRSMAVQSFMESGYGPPPSNFRGLRRYVWGEFMWQLEQQELKQDEQ